MVLGARYATLHRLAPCNLLVVASEENWTGSSRIFIYWDDRGKFRYFRRFRLDAHSDAHSNVKKMIDMTG